MKQILFVGFLVCSSLSAYSQAKQVLRKEIEKDELGVGSTIILNDGILTYGIDREKKTSTLNLVLFDRDFNEKQSKAIQYDNDYRLSSISQSNDKKVISYLFMDNAEYYFLNINTETLEETKVTGSLPNDISKKTLRLGFNGGLRLNDNVILYTLYKGRNFFSINSQTGKAKRITFFDNIKKFSIKSLEKTENFEFGTFMIEEIISKKEKKMKMFLFDEEGELQHEALTLENSEERRILDVSVTWMSKTKFTLTGSYSTGTKKNSQMATGIYFAEFEDFEQKFIKYYSLTDFKNFFEYLSEKQQAKIEKKIDKKKKKGQEDIVKVYIKMHPVIQQKNDYTLIGEVYFPTYRTETTTTYVNGKPTTTTRQVFDGFQYSHAVILKLELDGEKRYDQCFEMYLTNKPFSVVKNIRIKKEKDDLTLFYVTGSHFKACKVDDDGATEVDYGTLETEKDSEKVLSSSFTNAMYWYDDYFLSYGTQRIKDKEEKLGKRKRVVFVMTKIELN